MAPEPTTDPATWLDRHGDAMYRYAVLRLQDCDLAADAVQEALLAAVRERGTFRGESQERTWLIGILRHKVLDAIRRRVRDRGGSEASADPEGVFADGFWRERPAAWSELPADPIERAELRRVLVSCLASLPEAMRDALVLREIEGLPSKEVCKILDITPTNLWTLVHRGKIRLRRDLSDKWFSRTPPPARRSEREAGS